MNIESGKQYLARAEAQYDLAQRTLPRLAEEEFDKLRKSSRDLDVGGFLMDFAIIGETRRRNLERWASGRSISPATAEQAAAVTSALPSFTAVNSEAMSAMNVKESKKFRIDSIAEDIIDEIAQRLPRRIDAYRYPQNYAHEAIEIPGLGEIKVKMHQTGDGIFTTIGEIEGENFRIWNCRHSGVTYMDRFNDISRPQTITLKDEEGIFSLNAKKMEIDLYGDESGTFVTLDDKKFTNARWKTAVGRGYATDWQRDDLHRTDNWENKKEGNSWRDDPTELSWKNVETEAILWLFETVLNPLRQAPKPERQITIKPEEEPFPKDKIGPLYIFIREEDIQRINLIKDNPLKAYPDERKVMGSGCRLVTLDTPLRGAPEIAHDGFTWCGVGEITGELLADRNLTIGRTYKHDSFSGKEGIAVVKPKTATDIYVVDWQAREDYKEQLWARMEKENRDVTMNESIEFELAAARTMVSITEYNGGYKQPIVLIGRSLDLDEIERSYLPPLKSRNR